MSFLNDIEKISALMEKFCNIFPNKSISKNSVFNKPDLMSKRFISKRKTMAVGIIMGYLLLASSSVYAAAVLELNKRLAWDVVGLDSNDLTSGPDTFSVGYRYCNTGDAPATNVVATFYWDTTNPYINLTGAGNTISLDSLAAGACTDFYFNVQITRDDLARGTARQYHIGVTADGIASVDTPIDATNYNEIYVEDLISQNRNKIISITGPTTVYEGFTYQFTLVAKTATQGYEQLESFIDFPGNIFRIVKVDSTYSVGGINDAIYTDACGWVHDPEDPNYFTNSTNTACTGTGKAGGDITLVYDIEIIDTGTSNVTAVIYDFSGSSFHYNADFGGTTLSITALPSATLTLAKSVTNDNGGTAVDSDFTLTFDDGAGTAGTGIEGDAAISNVTVLPGNYALTETSLTGYKLDTISCDGSDTDGTDGVTLVGGEDVTCTYNNNDLGVDLSIVKTVNNSTTNIADTVTFSLQVSNAGPDTATNATVIDIVPSGFSYVTGSISGGDTQNDSDPAGTGLSWTINSLAAGANTTLTFDAIVKVP